MKGIIGRMKKASTKSHKSFIYCYRLTQYTCGSMIYEFWLNYLIFFSFYYSLFFLLFVWLVLRNKLSLGTIQIITNNSLQTLQFIFPYLINSISMWCVYSDVYSWLRVKCFRRIDYASLNSKNLNFYISKYITLIETVLMYILLT